MHLEWCTKNLKRNWKNSRSDKEPKHSKYSTVKISSNDLQESKRYNLVSLVSLFYGIPTFIGYWIVKTILAEQQWYYLTNHWGIREFMPFPKDISPKVNVIALLTYFKAAVQRFSHCAMGTPLGDRRKLAVAQTLVKYRHRYICTYTPIGFSFFVFYTLLEFSLYRESLVIYSQVEQIRVRPKNFELKLS